MDPTKAKLAAFFERDDEEDEDAAPGPSYTQSKSLLADEKRMQYVQPTLRKSRREKEQEAAEAKARDAEAETARAYEEFVSAFEGSGDRHSHSRTSFVKAESKAAYAPSAGKARFEEERSSSRRSSSPLVESAPRPKGKRAMDSFLEEIKREQAAREARFSRNSSGKSVTALAAYEGQTGSKDRGDAETTNVFVANLPLNVTEQSLGMFFARCGPVGSVKVMWPRGNTNSGPGGDPSGRRGLSGFVSFMTRADAEDALREFDGFDWGGSILRVGWSKAVSMASKPLYVNDAYRGRSSHRHRDDSKSKSRSREHDQDREYSSKRRKYSHSRSRSHERRGYHSSRRSWSRSRRRYESRSRSPRRRNRAESPKGVLGEGDDYVSDVFIRAVVAEMKSQDPQYEASLREREKSNPRYAFMFNKHHRRHVFYRGLRERQDLQGPEFDDDGYNSVYSTDSGEESERERTKRTILGKLAKKRFEAMLRALTGKRGELARCMAFGLEHAEAAVEVSELIIASLLVPSTPVPRKVARLHLICDILHNSAAPLPMAWTFRQTFQARLGIVFDHLATIYHSFPGRITADVFKKQITAVLDLWEDWIVFPPEFTAEMRARLDGAPKENAQAENEKSSATRLTAENEDGTSENAKFASKFKTSTFQPAAPVAIAAPDTEEDGEPMDIGDSDEEGPSGKAEAKSVEEDDLDGEPVADDVDGEPLDDEDVDGMPIADNVDGEPLDDDLDGAPIEDDVDGAPI